VFSPYYFWRGRREPEDHVCLNVALYGARSRWAMTERGRAAMARDATSYRIGPSSLRWEDDGLTVDIDETAVPHLTRLRARVRIEPVALNPRAFDLDPAGRHRWRPIAPAARATVETPRGSWSGAGYLDMNWGTEPLEAAFHRWDWSRAALGGGRSAILYDATRMDGGGVSLGLRFDAAGRMEELEPPPRVRLPRTLWRVDRRVQADDPSAVREVRRLEDSPFYARAELRTRLFGEDGHAVHETLDADRFATRWVKALLPWRMPRAQF
jgi:carotenoid 1,2-hydratase